MNRRFGVDELGGSFGQSRPKFEMEPSRYQLPKRAARRTQDYVLWQHRAQERIEGCPGSYDEPGNHRSYRVDRYDTHSSDYPLQGR